MGAREDEDLFDKVNIESNLDFYDEGGYGESTYDREYQESKGMFSQHNKLEEVKQSQDQKIGYGANPGYGSSTH